MVPSFDSVMCDWMGGAHVYKEPVKPLDSGRVIKIDREGVIEYEKRTWEQIRCPSSDTSIRVRCDGQRLDFSGNIGRFQQQDNSTGVGVIECVERWQEVLHNLGLDVRMFGAVHRAGTIAEAGTKLTRLDLASNFLVSDFNAFCRSKLSRPIGRRHPREGRYGPTWGYEAKRSNWWKAKVYDKQAELDGLRASKGGETIARFEIQLGGEWLKREKLHTVKAWGDDMAKIIYGRFAKELFKDTVSVEDWAQLPPRLRTWAVLWRDGVDIRNLVSRPTWFRIKSRLREYGINLDVPCNVVALTSRCRTIEVTPLHSLREAA